MQFGRYELLEKLASGGMGEVFRARVIGAEGFRRPVALKRIFPHLCEDETYRRMFIREAKIVANLVHTNIVQVYDLGMHEGALFIAMELVDGLDLAGVVKHLACGGKTLSLDVIAVIGFDVLEALDFAQNHTDECGRAVGLVHQDVSPQNLLIGARNGIVKLCDFGVVQLTGAPDTFAGVIAGKVGYMSPEQLRGKKLDGRSDIFSLGVILYELVSGRRLFDRRGNNLLAAARAELPVPALPESSEPGAALLEALIRRALASEREDRIPSAAEFRMGIEEFLLPRDPRAARRKLANLVQSIKQGSAEETMEPAEDPGRSEPGSSAWHHLLTRFETQAASARGRASETVPEELIATLMRAETAEGTELAVAVGQQTVHLTPPSSGRAVARPLAAAVRRRIQIGAVGSAILLGLVLVWLINTPTARQQELAPNPGASQLTGPALGRELLEGSGGTTSDVAPTVGLPSEVRESEPEPVVTSETVAREEQASTRQPPPSSATVARASRGVEARRPAAKAQAHQRRPARAGLQPEKGFGFLTLSAKPWAHVIIDGKRLDKVTPVRDLRLPVGTYQVDLEGPGELRASLVVRVTANEHIVRVVDLVQE